MIVKDSCCSRKLFSLILWCSRTLGWFKSCNWVRQDMIFKTTYQDLAVCQAKESPLMNTTFCSQGIKSVIGWRKIITSSQIEPPLSDEKSSIPAIWNPRRRQKIITSSQLEPPWVTKNHYFRSVGTTVGEHFQSVTDDGWRMTDDGRQVTDDGWRMTGGGWRVTDGGWRMTNGGWWMTKQVRSNSSNPKCTRPTCILARWSSLGPAVRHST